MGTDRQVMVCQVEAGQGRLGVVRYGAARHSAVRNDVVWQARWVLVWRVLVGCGEVWHGRHGVVR